MMQKLETDSWSSSVVAVDMVETSTMDVASSVYLDRSKENGDLTTLFGL